MSAREDNVREACGLGTGKCTRDDDQLSVGGATRALVTLPHLPYGDAVHAELAAAGLAPDWLGAGVRREKPGGRRELFLTLPWPMGHPDLDTRHWPRGMVLSWSHLTGWSVDNDDDVRVLDDVMDKVAAPGVVADAVLHLAVHGLDCEWAWPDGAGRWKHADHLDADLADFDEGVAR